MKKFITVLLLICPLLAFAQDLVSFKLTPEGTFTTISDEDYMVIPFEGKSAHEIYQTLASNVGSVYNDPSKVMSGVDDASIKIRSIIPISQKIDKIFMLGDVLIEVNGYMQYEIRIKDGRVRVTAPYIENDIWIDGGASGNFRNLVSQWFKPEKKEKKRVENEKKITELEMRVNSVINSVLGLNKTQEDDNW